MSKNISKLLITQPPPIEFTSKSLIISNHHELQIFINELNTNEKFKFCYLNNNDINERITLSISINDNPDKINFSSFFYLSLIIDNNNNYDYSIDFIKTIYNYFINQNNKERKLFLSKLIFQLITKKNFNENEIILKMKNEVEKFINDNTNNVFGVELNKNVFLSKNIDEIYTDILYRLTRKNVFNDYLESLTILEKLDIENINMTDKMLEELLRVLNYDDNYIKQYMISKVEDLIVLKKINFYYLFLKFVLKEQIYIYQIPLFLNTRRYIYKIFKKRKYMNKFLEINYDNNLEIKNRLDFIIIALLGTKYYNNNYYNKIYNVREKLKEQGIVQNTEVIKHCFFNYKLFMDNYEKYLLENLFVSSSFEIIINGNNCKYRITKINKIIFNKYNKLDISILEEIKVYVRNNNDLYQNVEYLLAFLKEIKDRLILEYKFSNLYLNFDLKNKPEIMNRIFNLSCYYNYLQDPQENKKQLKFKDENVLIQGTFTETQGFPQLMEEIRNENNINNNSNNNNKNNNNKNNSTFNNLNSKTTKESFLYSKKTSSTTADSNSSNNNSNDNYYQIYFVFMERDIKYMKQLKNRYIIFYGKQRLILCDKNCEKIKDYKFPEEIINLIVINLDDTKIVGYNKKKCYLIQLKYKNKTETDDEFEDFVPEEIEIPSQILLENNIFFIVYNNDEISKYMNIHFYNQNKDKKTIIMKKTCKDAILIENDLFMISYNKNKDIPYELIIFDTLRKKEIRAIDLEEITSIYSNLFMINDFLLCLSIESKDNKVLFINIKTQKKIDYTTSNFKVNCFCSLNSNQEISNNSQDTLIFLAGGSEDFYGKIILFKVEYDNNNEISKIDEELFVKSNNPINCINYIKKKKEILFIDQEGNIYKKNIQNYTDIN